MLYHAEATHCPRAAVLSVDLEKAFDTVGWQYLFEVMRYMGLGEEWIRWVQLLYAAPTARVRTGRTVSREYGVFRGTRQGCPLSPLLFALAMEPLAERLRQGGLGIGLELAGRTHYVSLYADDLLAYLEDAVEGTQTVMQLLDGFADLSGLRVNKTKTYLFPVRAPSPDQTL